MNNDSAADLEQEVIELWEQFKFIPAMKKKRDLLLKIADRLGWLNLKRELEK